MKDLIENIIEENKRLTDFMEKNIDVLSSKTFQSKSDIEIFNKIGEYATSKGLHPVYFKSKHLSDYCSGINLEIVDIHYIHIYDTDELSISIYYDEYGALSLFMKKPYYELYNLYDEENDIERFLKNEEDEILLFNKVKLLLKNRKGLK